MHWRNLLSNKIRKKAKARKSIVKKLLENMYHYLLKKSKYRFGSNETLYESSFKFVAQKKKRSHQTVPSKYLSYGLKYNNFDFYLSVQFV